MPLPQEDRGFKRRLHAPGTNDVLSWNLAVKHIVPRETWLERFATQLLLLRPRLSALEAAQVAFEEYEEAQDFDPEVAAAMYADDSTDV